MRHAATAVATTRHRESDAQLHDYAADGYTADGTASLPPLTKRWPRLRDRGIEWTEMRTVEPQRPKLTRVIHVLRLAR